eukprot:TRINITY_DN23271_c0_g1_i1.p1 TRINITY_DN23271_c0_g1~~TRINITY_DN23271_c0_g1_i1.p1  ORF type:complete len:720 (-),score=75.92 TRINITY_DN23271_c0_g1_i1:247-2406(-)
MSALTIYSRLSVRDGAQFLYPTVDSLSGGKMSQVTLIQSGPHANCGRIPNAGSKADIYAVSIDRFTHPASRAGSKHLSGYNRRIRSTGFLVRPLSRSPAGLLCERRSLSSFDEADRVESRHASKFRNPRPLRPSKIPRVTAFSSTPRRVLVDASDQQPIEVTPDSVSPNPNGTSSPSPSPVSSSVPVLMSLPPNPPSPGVRLRIFQQRVRSRLRVLGRVARRELVTKPLLWFKAHHRKVLFLLFVFGGIYTALFLLPSSAPSYECPYSDFIRLVKSNDVADVALQESSNLIFFNSDLLREQLRAASPPAVTPPAASGGLISAFFGAICNFFGAILGMSTKAASPQNPVFGFLARRPKRDEAMLFPILLEAGVRFRVVSVSWGSSIRSTVLAALLLWVPLLPLAFFAMRQLSGFEGLSKRKPAKSPMTSFDDVAGVDAAKEELLEIVRRLKSTRSSNVLLPPLPRGILLVGPPGTGKTLLARAVAGEAGVPFYATSASEFVEMFVGRGAARVRALFAEARKRSPSIIFIDELDAVGSRRGGSLNDERDQTLNQLLTEMDGFESSDSGILVLAATNRVEALDPALCRPGRISRQVVVGLPDVKGREDILSVHLRGKPVSGDAAKMKRVVAIVTSGFAGADLANLVNEAALLAARKGESSLTLEHMMEAVDRAKFGVGGRIGPVRLFQRWAISRVAKAMEASTEVEQFEKLPSERPLPSTSQ